jgi:hypothetical protein
MGLDRLKRVRPGSAFPEKGIFPIGFPIAEWSIRMKRKLTTAKRAKIIARRAQGVGFAELAKEFGLGLATIHRALKGATAVEPTPAAPRSVPPPVKVVGEPVPTREELLGYLSAQARTLRADAARATDAPTRAAANRNLIAVQALITKLVPPPAEPEGTMLVPVGEMEAEARKGETRLLALVENMFAKETR